MNFDKANIVFFILSMSMYFFMFIGGNLMKKSKNRRQYWTAAIIPILAFTLNMGLRWGRGPDYNTGYNVFIKIANDLQNAEDYEPIWKLSINFFYYIVDSYQLFVAFCSFFLIYSFVYLSRNHKEVLSISLPIFAFLVFPSENLIRWFYAFSFILIGLYHLEKAEWTKYLLFAGLGFITHYASIIVSFPFLVIFMFFKNKILLKPWISIILFICLFLFFKETDLLFLAPLLTSFEIGGNLSDYQQNIDATLTNSFGDYSGALTGTSLITTPLLLYLGYKLIAYRRNLIPFYNIMVIGQVTMAAFVQIQMLYRISLLFSIFEYIMISYITIDMILYKSCKIKFYKLLSLLLVIVFLRSMFVQPFVKEANQTYYVWDANGRKTL